MRTSRDRLMLRQRESLCHTVMYQCASTRLLSRGALDRFFCLVPSSSPIARSKAEHISWGWGFSLHVLADLRYMTYHLNWTAFLFTHTISEVLDLVAFVLLFVAETKGVRLRQPSRQVGSVPAAS
jgi:hypothetical protein